MKFNRRILGLLVVVLIFLSACSTPEIQGVEVTRIVKETIVQTQIITIVVTATPEPPTPAPKFQAWTSEQAIEAFKTANLEAENTRPMTKDDYGAAPFVAEEGTRFFIPSLCADCGGRAISFSNREDLDLVKNYYVELGEASSWFFSWVFEKDNILIQINGDLPEEQALKYQAALDNME
ncbi:MAG TPA: hypothetical protein ENF22_02405 [Chloroflexi bacterium]|nr:hypothetical protein [Chloroflexota bacterium]